MLNKREFIRHLVRIITKIGTIRCKKGLYKFNIRKCSNILDLSNYNTTHSITHENVRVGMETIGSVGKP